MTLVLAFAIATPLVALAWLLLMPLAVCARAEGSLDEGVRLEADARFAPLVARVRGWPPTVELRIAGLRLPLRRWRTQPTSRAHVPPGDRVPKADDTLRFLLRHRHLLGVRRIDGWITFGCEDPALTGQVHGLLCAARPLLDPHGRVGLLPDWSMHDVLAGRLEVELRLAAGRLALAYGWRTLSRSARRRRARARPPARPGRSDTSRTATAPAA